MSQQISDRKTQDRPSSLRHSFVAMLFALVAARIGVSAIELVQILCRDGASWNGLAAASQLALALAVLTASWVGWSQTALISDKALRLRTPFSRPYLLLLVDVALVIVYYGIASTVDTEEQLILDGSRMTRRTVLAEASATPECWAVVVMFGLYLLWDVLMKVCQPPAKPGEDLRRYRITGRRYWLYAFVQTRASVYCLALSIAILAPILLHVGSPHPAFSIIVDLTLLVAVYYFRLAKHQERRLARRCRLPHQAFTRRKDRRFERRLRTRAFWTLAILLMSLWACCVWQLFALLGVP